MIDDEEEGIDDPDDPDCDDITDSPGDTDDKSTDGKHKDSQSRDWMLTIRAEGHTEDDVKALFEKIGVGAVFQREIGGKTEYEHFQCVLQVKTPMRFSTLKNHLTDAGFGDAHIEPRRKTVEDCVNYCTKEETRAGEPIYVGKINMKDKQGQRSDLIGFREQILGGMSVQEVLLGDTEAKAAHCTRCWASWRPHTSAKNTVANSVILTCTTFMAHRASVRPGTYTTNIR